MSTLDVYDPFTSMRCNKFSHTVSVVASHTQFHFFTACTHSQTHTSYAQFMYIQYVNALPYGVCVYMHFCGTCKLEINFPMPFILSSSVFAVWLHARYADTFCTIFVGCCFFFAAVVVVLFCFGLVWFGLRWSKGMGMIWSKIGWVFSPFNHIVYTT